MQNFLARAAWDEDGVREDLRDFVVDCLGVTDGPGKGAADCLDRDGPMLVVDETGDLKKGTKCRGRHFSPYDEPTVMPTSTTMPQVGSACLRHYVGGQSWSRNASRVSGAW